MNTEHTAMRYGPIVSLLACVLWLSACDGGIFGTGGGDADTTLSNNDVDDNVAGEPVSGGDENALTTPDGSGSQPPTAIAPDPDATDNDTSQRAQPFENLIAGTERNEPVIAVINVSQSPVLLRLDNSNEQTVVNAGESISGIPASPASRILEVLVERSSSQPPSGVVFDPLTLDMSSLSTLVVRNGPDADDENVIDVVPLRSLLQSGDPMLSRVTLVQAATLDPEDTSVSFELRPAGANPGATPINFNALNYRTASSGPMSTPEGDYQLVDPSGRFPPQALSFIGGRNYTVVITGGEPAIRIEVVSAATDIPLTIVVDGNR